MCDEFCGQDLKSLPLPKEWTDNVRYAVLNVICIVRIAWGQKTATRRWLLDFSRRALRGFGPASMVSPRP